MTKDRALYLLGIERKCVEGNDGRCDRDCSHCDLVQNEQELLEMYDYVINRIKADAVTPIVNEYPSIEKLANLMTKYFCEVDLKITHTDLEKLAIKIATDGMELVGWLTGYLEDFISDKQTKGERV